LVLRTADLAEAGIDMATVTKFLTAAIKGVVASQVQDAIDDPLVRIDRAAGHRRRPAPGADDLRLPGAGLQRLLSPSF
jgi:hypothetical protein